MNIVPCGDCAVSIRFEERIAPEPVDPGPRARGDRPVHTAPPGAGNEVRTRDPKLGKLVLYRLSYSRGRQPG